MLFLFALLILVTFSSRVSLLRKSKIETVTVLTRKGENLGILIQYKIYKYVLKWVWKVLQVSNLWYPDTDAGHRDGGDHYFLSYSFGCYTIDFK